MLDRDIEMRARECLADTLPEGCMLQRLVLSGQSPDDEMFTIENVLTAMIAFAATSAVAADGEAIKHAWNAGYTTGRNHADDPPFAGLGKHNRQHGWELYACSLTDRNLAALSASPLPGREEIRMAIFRHTGCSEKCADDAADAIVEMLSTPPTEG